MCPETGFDRQQPSRSLLDEFLPGVTVNTSPDPATDPTPEKIKSPRKVSQSPMKTSTSRKVKNEAKTKEVADSWEDEDDALSEDEAKDMATAAVSARTRSASPSSHSNDWNLVVTSASSSSCQGEPSDLRRPEKTDAVARSMIAAGLGLRAPKQTEEQKAYQKSILDQERKRREQEKAQEQRRKEEADKARAAIWYD